MSCDNIMKITEEERKAIGKSFNRTEKEINEDIQCLKDWLKKEPHLPQDEDETRLRMMLYYNKFSLEKTKSKLDMYYSVKNIVPEFYVDREPLNPQISKQMDYLILLPLPNLNGDLNRIILSKVNDKDSDNFDMTLYMRLFFGMMDLIMMHDTRLASQVIIDMVNYNLGLIMKITPVVIKQAVMILQKAYSDKIKGFHFIHIPPYAQALVSFLNTILSEKLSARIYIHKNLESLNKVISSKTLPKEYGGTAAPLHELHDNWKKYYKSQNDWLKELGDKKSDETKRIGEPIDSDMFGMCGSFRNLDFD